MQELGDFSWVIYFFLKTEVNGYIQSKGSESFDVYKTLFYTSSYTYSVH